MMVALRWSLYFVFLHSIDFLRSSQLSRFVDVKLLLHLNCKLYLIHELCLSYKYIGMKHVGFEIFLDYSASYSKKT